MGLMGGLGMAGGNGGMKADSMSSPSIKSESDAHSPGHPGSLSSPMSAAHLGGGGGGPSGHGAGLMEEYGGMMGGGGRGASGAGGSVYGGGRGGGGGSVMDETSWMVFEGDNVEVSSGGCE